MFVFCVSDVRGQNQENTTFTPKVISNTTELGTDVILKEDRLRVDNQVKCSFGCSEQTGCLAFLYENNRCILIGNSSLSGDDVIMTNMTEGMKIYEKHRKLPFTLSKGHF